jgi:tetratricopeptide (TPR) repeat protein
MERSAWRELQTLLGVLLIAATIYWMARSHRRDPTVFACLVLAALTYIPVSGILPLNSNVAEHWLYVPLAFLFLAATVAISRLRVPFPALATVLALWLVFLGARTCLRTFDWKNQRTFLERTMASGGESARMLINLGSLEMNEARFDIARKHLEAALQKEPDHPLAIINLASLALKQNDFAAARALANRAKDLPLVDAQAYELLALLEFKEHNRVQPVRFRLAARTGPPNWRIERRYIEVLDETGDTAAAISELGGVLRTQWYRAESWQLLSRLLAKAGSTRDAAEALEQAKAYDVHLEKHPEVVR